MGDVVKSEISCMGSVNGTLRRIRSVQRGSVEEEDVVVAHLPSACKFTAVGRGEGKTASGVFLTAEHFRRKQGLGYLQIYAGKFNSKAGGAKVAYETIIFPGFILLCCRYRRCMFGIV